MKSPALSNFDVANAASDAGLDGASIVLRRLAPEPRVEIDVRGDHPVYPASMIKVPLGAVILTLVERKVLALDDRRPVDASNMTGNDMPSPLVAGYSARIDELVELMITQSDNVATNTLIDVAGRERATEALHALGLAGTAIRRKLSGALPLIDDPLATGRNTHPARDAARLFELIARRETPWAGALESVLSRQKWNDKLSRGLGAQDRFAHKTGETDEGSHDGGILYTSDGATWVIVVYTALPSGPPADAKLGAFMKALRPELATR